jgi:uncharacterized glyoxalase superfamily protein PhnB
MAATFSAIELVVADLGASRDFYRRLGWDVPDGDDHLELTLPGGVRVLWDVASHAPDFYPGWTPPSGGHRVALAFELESPAEVDDLHAALIAAGVSNVRDPWDAFWGQRFASVSDPDGNTVDLFAALPAG